MKKLLYITLILWWMTSCYPPRIVYAVDNIFPYEDKDSIDIQLRKGSTISVDAKVLRTILSFDICNNSNSTHLLKNKNNMQAVVGSTILNYEFVEGDTLLYTLKPGVKRNVFLIFESIDEKYLLYKSPNNINGHILKLHLEFENITGNKYEKQVILKSFKTRKLVYENEH